MYAITFDLDQESLSRTYGSNSFNNAYLDVKSFLMNNGFIHQQGSVYFGSSDRITTAVDCILVIQSLSKKYSWFSASVRDIRMLRIEENNNLMPILKNN